MICWFNVKHGHSHKNIHYIFYLEKDFGFDSSENVIHLLFRRNISVTYQKYLMMTKANKGRNNFSCTQSALFETSPTRRGKTYYFQRLLSEFRKVLLLHDYIWCIYLKDIPASGKDFTPSRWKMGNKKVPGLKVL